MNKSIFLYIIILQFCFFETIAQKITRGPDVGEIYFIGLTHDGIGLYYSTDFGETAICVDNSNNIKTVAADVTKGCVYCVKQPHNLYYSSSYGNSGTWIFKNGGIEISQEIECGITHGHIFSSFYLYSQNFGYNFSYLNCNGFFGNNKYAAIDIVNDSIGYALSYKQNVGDSVYLFTTSDKFENLYLSHVFNFSNGETIFLSCGNKLGEIFLFNKARKTLQFSNSFGEHFLTIAKYNFINPYSLEIVGGKIDGEFYILLNFANQLWQNAHSYIFHSTDYGKTFEVFHPFEKGNQPVLANFSSAQTEGTAPYTIEWCNFSIGENASYEWDFDNDGIIDSNEEKPVYIYEEPGIYSVKLSVVGSDSTNSFLKEDYITVYPFPAPPQDLTAEVVDDDVFLNWQPILLDTTLIGYNVYRDTTLLTPEPITYPNYDDLNLPNGIYEYCVSAVYTYAVSEETCVEASITVGIENLEEAGLMFYPNPADEEIFIHFPGSFQVSVFNSTGKQVFNQKEINQSARIYVGDLPGGIYYILINGDRRKLTKKIIIR